MNAQAQALVQGFARFGDADTLHVYLDGVIVLLGGSSVPAEVVAPSLVRSGRWKGLREAMEVCGYQLLFGVNDHADRTQQIHDGGRRSGGVPAARILGEEGFA